MGLLPPVILGALLIVAFALSSQQRLTIASHTGPVPARQIAYQMRVHHQAAIALKQADPALSTVTDALNDNDFLFLSCINGNTVATVMMTVTGIPLIPRVMVGQTEANAVVEELARQSVMAPELGRVGQTAWSAGYDGVAGALITPVVGVGTSDAANIHTTTGLVPLPDSCLAPAGAPVILTQVLP